MKGETVYFESAALAANFDKAMTPEAQKVLDSVKWGGS